MTYFSQKYLFFFTCEIPGGPGFYMQMQYKATR